MKPASQIFKKKSILFFGVVFAVCVLAVWAYESWDYGNYSAYDTTRIAMYNFNNGTGTSVYDDSGRGKSGTLYGNTSWVNERDNNLTGIDAALEFDGSSDYVRVYHSNDFNISSADVDGFVMSAMIKVPADCTKSYLSILSKINRYRHPDHPYEYEYDYSYGFYFYLTNGNLRFSAYNGQVDENPTSYYLNIQDSDGVDLRDGEWHFVAVEFRRNNDVGIYELIIDPTETNAGVVETKSLGSGYQQPIIQPGNSTKDFFIGRRDISWDYDKDFEGIIDCVYFYEIDSNSVPNSGHRMWGNTNVGYWSFDEGEELDPRNIVNDLVRWTSFNAGYHSYGETFGTGIAYIARPFPWKGQHNIELNNRPPEEIAYVQVYDPVNVLDFNAPMGQEDLYVEFLIKAEYILYQTPNFILTKFDDVPIPNGYRFYLIGTTPYSAGQLVFEIANNGVTTSITTPVNSIDYNWIHVWAWVENGTMFLKMKNEETGYVWPIMATPSCGIGATSSDLFFGTQLIYGGFDHTYNYNGHLDEVVIGHCFPQ
jgi:hypothetical protein